MSAVVGKAAEYRAASEEHARYTSELAAAQNVVRGLEDKLSKAAMRRTAAQRELLEEAKR